VAVEEATGGVTGAGEVEAPPPHPAKITTDTKKDWTIRECKTRASFMDVPCGGLRGRGV
jgi:hypothetical protein